MADPRDSTSPAPPAASAVERRAATLPGRRTVKKEWQAAWLLRAVTLLDLTTLAGDDTPSNVRRLCAKAVRPVRDDLLAAMGAAHLGRHDAFSQQLECHGLQGITGEQGGGFVELAMAGGLAATQIVVIHAGQVIVDQRVAVYALHGKGGGIGL